MILMSYFDKTGTNISYYPRGYFHIGSKRKNLGRSVTTRRKVGRESQFWGHLGLYLKFKKHNLGYFSLSLLEAKFGAPTRISEANFEAKPPDLLIWRYPTGVIITTKGPSTDTLINNLNIAEVKDN